VAALTLPNTPALASMQPSKARFFLEPGQVDGTVFVDHGPGFSTLRTFVPATDGAPDSAKGTDAKLAMEGLATLPAPGLVAKKEEQDG
jgi:hypothetical protein